MAPLMVFARPPDGLRSPSPRCARIALAARNLHPEGLRVGRKLGHDSRKGNPGRRSAGRGLRTFRRRPIKTYRFLRGPSCEWPSYRHPSSASLLLRGLLASCHTRVHPPGSVARSHGLCVLLATRRPDLRRCRLDPTACSPPIGLLDTPLESNLPSFCPETAGLEQLLRVTLTPSFLFVKTQAQKNQGDALSNCGPGTGTGRKWRQIFISPVGFPQRPRGRAKINLSLFFPARPSRWGAPQSSCARPVDFEPTSD